MGKISLSNIAEELAAKAGLSRENANNFAHAFVDTIEKGLQADGVVKVKGLGTFKLQEVSDRDSVDVNTGERITIKGYRKVTFTPDTVMKEFVNRPFAHFEPTELNEGYPTDDDFIAEQPTSEDLAEETIDIKEPVAESTVTEEPETAPIVVEEPVAEEPVAEPAPLSPTTQEEPVVEPVATEDLTQEEPTEEPVAPLTPTADYQSAPEPMTEDPASTEQSAPEQPVKPRRRRGGLWVCLILLLLVAGVAVSYVKGWLPSMMTFHVEEPVSDMQDIQVKSDLEEELKAEWGEAPSEAPAAEAAAPAPTEDSTATEQPTATERPSVEQPAAPMSPTADYQSAQKAATESQPAPKAEPKSGVLTLTPALQAKAVKDITLADTTDYTISGTMLTHKLKSGETIIQLSNKYYGDKRLWPYIVKHNRMKNFNSVAIGQAIQIPVLEAR